MHKCWSLYNRVEKLRIDDLTRDQVRTILLSIPTSKINDWYACREGELHWQPLLEFPEFYEDASSVRGEFQPPPARDEASEATPPTSRSTKSKKSDRRPLFEEGPDASISTLQIESVPTKERRSARRYVRNLIFYAKSGAKVFECETKDISMSGLSLARKLPDEFPKNFKAELRLNGGVIRVLVVRVSATSLKIQDAEAWDQLRQWIVSW